MELAVRERQPEFYKQLSQEMNNGYISHAYLVETNNNNLDVVRDYIVFLVKKIYEESYKSSNVVIPLEKLMHLIDKNEFPDYIEVNPIGNLIRKDQLIVIKDLFSRRSLYGTKQIYTIFEADRMNESAANTILKFLEEPYDDVVAIFVTNNRYNIIDTILSRCQIISLKCEEVNGYDYNEFELAFFTDVDNRGVCDLMLYFNKYFNGLFKDKTNAILSVKNALVYYKSLLNNNDYGKKGYSLEDLISVISIFEESLKKLKYNVNIKLWLDNMLLSLMEVGDGNFKD